MTSFEVLVSKRFTALKLDESKVQIEYVFVDGSGQLLRSKTRTIAFSPSSANEIPVTFYNGNRTGQPSVPIRDFTLHPVALYKDPFRGGKDLLVFCDARDDENRPAKGNHRPSCLEAMQLAAKYEPVFGIEQEYVMLEWEDGRPLGWPKGGCPAPRQNYPAYMGVGAENIAGRRIAESHYRACLYAGIPMWGVHSEGCLGQWEYQIGLCPGISIGDDLWMSRYILYRVAEEFEIKISLEPKVLGPQNLRSDAHTNFSTNLTRGEDGNKHLIEAVEKLRVKHDEHMRVYDPYDGKDSQARRGEACALSVDFTSGVGDRNTCVRIPKFVQEAGCGYLEDRRPCSNADPFRVSEALVRTACLG